MTTGLGILDGVPHGPGPCVVRRYGGLVHRRLASDLLLRCTALNGPPKVEAAIGGALVLAWPRTRDDTY